MPSSGDKRRQQDREKKRRKRDRDPDPELTRARARAAYRSKHPAPPPVDRNVNRQPLYIAFDGDVYETVLMAPRGRSPAQEGDEDVVDVRSYAEQAAWLREQAKPKPDGLKRRLRVIRVDLRGALEALVGLSEGRDPSDFTGHLVEEIISAPLPPRDEDPDLTLNRLLNNAMRPRAGFFVGLPWGRWQHLLDDDIRSPAARLVALLIYWHHGPHWRHGPQRRLRPGPTLPELLAAGLQELHEEEFAAALRELATRGRLYVGDDGRLLYCGGNILHDDRPRSVFAADMLVRLAHLQQGGTRTAANSRRISLFAPPWGYTSNWLARTSGEDMNRAHLHPVGGLKTSAKRIHDARDDGDSQDDQEMAK